MNIIGAVAIIAIIAIIASIVGFAATHRAFLHKPLRTRIAATLFLSVLAMPAALFAIYYFHIIPEYSWFYTLRSFPGSELLSIFTGAAGGAFATCLPRSFLTAPLCGSIALSIVPYLKMVMSPLQQAELCEKWEGDVCLQSTASTCGPASTATILRSLGINATEHEIATAAFTSSSGTEAWYLARYVRRLGVNPKFDFRKTFAPEVGLPAVVGVTLGSFGHFIAVIDLQDGQITYADPVNGKHRTTLADFRERYDFTGFHMTLNKRL